MNLVHYAKNIPSALMNAASAGWDMACRTIGECRFGRDIDNEFGNMVLADGAAANFTGPKLFSYIRYDPDVSQAGLDALGLSDIEAASVQVMDSVDHIGEIQHVGTAYAEKYVRSEHLAPFG